MSVRYKCGHIEMDRPKCEICELRREVKQLKKEILTLDRRLVDRYNVGFYVGYDVGFEQGVAIHKLDNPGVCPGCGSDNACQGECQTDSLCNHERPFCHDTPKCGRPRVQQFPAISMPEPAHGGKKDKP